MPLQNLALHLAIRAVREGDVLSDNWFDSDCLGPFSRREFSVGSEGQIIGKSWQEFLSSWVVSSLSDPYLHCNRPPIHSLAFAGTETWIPSFKSMGQQVVIRATPSRYEMFAEVKELREEFVSVDVAASNLKASVQVISDYTKSTRHPDVDYWCTRWEKVISDDFDSSEYASSATWFPERFRSEANQRAALGIMNSWCFGGMGWWNDYACGPEADQVGKLLYDSFCECVLAMGNGSPN